MEIWGKNIPGQGKSGLAVRDPWQGNGRGWPYVWDRGSKKESRRNWGHEGLESHWQGWAEAWQVLDLSMAPSDHRGCHNRSREIVYKAVAKTEWEMLVLWTGLIALMALEWQNSGYVLEKASKIFWLEREVWGEIRCQHDSKGLSFQMGKLSITKVRQIVPLPHR